MENNSSIPVKLGHGWIHVERIILMATSLLCVGIVAIGVFTRYIFHVDFYGQEELITLFATWLYWIGGAYASYDNSHIQADILNTMVKRPKVLFILNIINLAVTIVVLVIFSKWSFDYTIQCIAINSVTTGLKIPMVTSQCALFVGFLLMFIHTIINFVIYLRKGVGAVAEQIAAREEVL